jgi:hypothetical protein
MSRTYDLLESPPGTFTLGGVDIIGAKNTGTLEVAARTVQSETIAFLTE